MWKDIGTGKEYKTRISAFWNAHLEQIRDFYRSGEKPLAYFAALVTPIVLDLYGDRFEFVE